MRVINIIRAKRMNGAAMKLTVEVDGYKMGKLGNGQQLAVQVDENVHELYVHGGALAGKEFCDRLPIPAGTYAYGFQIDMISYKNNNTKPILRPCADTALPENLRTISLIGITLTSVLLDAKLRSALVQMPQAVFQLGLYEDGWLLFLCHGGQKQVLVRQPYGQTRGSLLAAAINAIEHGDLKTPEGRAKVTEKIFADYLNYLPDYHRVGPDTFMFKG